MILDSVFRELWRLWRSILLMNAISAFRMGFIGQMCSCLTWTSRASTVGKEDRHQSHRHEMTVEDAMVERQTCRGAENVCLFLFNSHDRNHQGLWKEIFKNLRYYPTLAFHLNTNPGQARRPSNFCKNIYTCYHLIWLSAFRPLRHQRSGA